MKPKIARIILGSMITVAGIMFIVKNMVNQYRLDTTFPELVFILVVSFLIGLVPVGIGLGVIFWGRD